jgi:hypothetical protein
MGQHIQQRTVIRRKGKSPFKPARVIVLPCRASAPVDDAVSSKRGFDGYNKEVLFELTDETIEVESRFSLRKMVYNGQLQL